MLCSLRDRRESKGDREAESNKHAVVRHMSQSYASVGQSCCCLPSRQAIHTYQLKSTVL